MHDTGNMKAIIPEPVGMVYKSSHFIINKDTLILFGKSSESICLFLKSFLETEFNLNLNSQKLNKIKKKNNCIVIEVNKLKIDSYEAYQLNITEDKINITASLENGLFYGIQTLIQLIYKDNPNFGIDNELVKLNCLEIMDYPRFQWRGFMLDEARNFFGKDIVKNILDNMASLKFNIFHWHLTDDQGWRIEIKKYPLLTEIGSRRKGTDVSKHKGFVHSSIKKVETDGIPVYGYYTQEDIKEIIDYAAERYITVIPEIDIPGHTMALLAAYPELSCTGGPFEVGTRFGIYKDVLCIGKEIVFKYIENILSEIIELFPSEYIHIGGDETPRTRWKRCPNCQARMKREHIHNVDTLQTYFTNRVAEFILAHGKRIICWNETIEKNLNKELYCQYWNAHFERVIKELIDGRKVIISEANHVYLNYPYKVNSLENTYHYDPIPIALNEEHHKNIIGIEACLWTEYVKTRAKLDWHLFPRLLAIAEIGWTQKNNKNYREFEKRLDIYLKSLQKKQINFAQKEEYEGKFTTIAKNYFDNN